MAAAVAPVAPVSSTTAPAVASAVASALAAAEAAVTGGAVAVLVTARASSMGRRQNGRRVSRSLFVRRKKFRTTFDRRMPVLGFRALSCPGTSQLRNVASADTALRASQCSAEPVMRRYLACRWIRSLPSLRRLTRCSLPCRRRPRRDRPRPLGRALLLQALQQGVRQTIAQANPRRRRAGRQTGQARRASWPRFNSWQPRTTYPPPEPVGTK